MDDDTRRRRLALVAMVGPAVFVALVALLHVLEPETNDSDAISEYALGDYGLLMNAAFVAAGVGVAALAAGLRGAIPRSRSAACARLRWRRSAPFCWRSPRSATRSSSACSSPCSCSPSRSPRAVCER
jgi:hypothetical protein